MKTRTFLKQIHILPKKFESFQFNEKDAKITFHITCIKEPPYVYAYSQCSNSCLVYYFFQDNHYN